MACPLPLVLNCRCRGIFQSDLKRCELFFHFCRFSHNPEDRVNLLGVGVGGGWGGSCGGGGSTVVGGGVVEGMTLAKRGASR